MDLLSDVFKAGVVGCGGAGFPTHAKLDTKVEYFLVNGAECEPMLRTDRFLMKTQAARLLEAIRLVGEHLGAKRRMIALKKTYSEEITALIAAIEASGGGVELLMMENYYPAGDEQMIVREATGRTTPPGGIPLDVGAVVSNVHTLLCVWDAVRGIPFTHRVLTVNGEVGEPVLVSAPVGTSLGECLELAGGATVQNPYLLSGGPLMGKPVTESDVVTKTTSGLIVLPPDAYLADREEISVAHMVNRARAACIQCTLCTQMCPRYLIGHPLQPHRIMRELGAKGSLAAMLDSEAAKQALICCECGICTMFACPMQLQPSEINVLLKKEYAAAGVRYTKGTGDYSPNEERELRKTPSRRMASRAGVLPYYDKNPSRLVEYEPRAIAVPLLQHIGAPSQPVVAVGEPVAKGQLIARCPEGKLGANIHAGIAGTVTSVSDRITIKG